MLLIIGYKDLLLITEIKIKTFGINFRFLKKKKINKKTKTKTVLQGYKKIIIML